MDQGDLDNFGGVADEGESNLQRTIRLLNVSLQQRGALIAHEGDLSDEELLTSVVDLLKTTYGAISSDLSAQANQSELTTSLAESPNPDASKYRVLLARGIDFKQVYYNALMRAETGDYAGIKGLMAEEAGHMLRSTEKLDQTGGETLIRVAQRIPLTGDPIKIFNGNATNGL